ncbi:MAG: helix-turn-helix domain-containing protein [Chloroflexi bacterium]|nr:helix-turn-helix domain-containing protein [Chloroflexota bacterium]
MDTHALTFGEQLRSLRIRACLSQAALAERANISVAAVAALERGKRTAPYPSTLDALAQALGLAAQDRAALIALAGALRRSTAPPRLLPPDPVSRPDVVPPRLGRPADELPMGLTSFVGRQAELEAARTLLDPASSRVRLLTLVGPGGVGKTRLAVAVAASVASAYPDGVVFVDLASVRDSRLVAASIAHALEIREAGGRSARELLFEHLSARRILLVLDNFEHVRDAGPLLAEVLSACPNAALLVTSRVALLLQGEHRFPLAPLVTPAEEESSAAAVLATPSVRLFLERARATAPDFRLMPADIAAIGAICRRLDGMPLAIELAAARVAVLSPPALLRRLEHRLALLTHGAADLPERQQTLRNTLAWSYGLLRPADQMLFNRLAIFARGCTVEAAEAVCADAALPGEEVLDGLQVLVDSSLVQVNRLDEPTREPRFGMLETVREYALGCLRESGQDASIQDRHLTYYLTLAEQATVELFGPRLAGWLARLDCDLGNLRACLEYAWDRGQIAIGLRLAGALAPFWSTRGYGSEGRAWLTRLIEGMERVEVAAAVGARALYGAGMLANAQGDQYEAMQLLDRAVVLYRAAGDPVGAVRVLNTRGGVDYDRGDLQAAMTCYTTCVGLARAANDLGEVARALANLGEVHFHLGDLRRAEACHEEALVLAQQAGRVDIEAYQLSDLGNVACRLGDLARAATLHRRALGLKYSLGDHRRIAISLEDMAALAVAEGRMERAARLLGAATELRAAIGTPRPVPERMTTERTSSEARAALGEEDWAAAFATGRSLPLAEIISDALEEAIAAPDVALPNLEAR